MPSSLSSPASPQRGPSSPAAEAPKESVVARLFITPVSFISFLISLALVDQHNWNLRAHYHAPSQSPSSQTLRGRLRDFFHQCVWEPQPYAYVRSPEARASDTGPTGASEEPWHLHSNQKKMMRMEVSDAFRMRKWVVVAMVVGMAVFASLAVGVLHFAYRLLRARF